MKNNKIVITGSLILGFVLLNASINKTNAQELAYNESPTANSNDQSYTPPPQKPALHVAIEPSFPGGTDSLENYLFMHITAPDSLFKRDISGSIYFSFYVENDGKIDRVKIENGISSPGWDSAAISCVRTMPNWIPGSVNEAPKAMRYFLPVSVPPGHELFNVSDSLSIR